MTIHLIRRYDGFEQIVTGVYGPYDRRQRGIFFWELGKIRKGWELLWISGDNFNIVRFQHDRKDGEGNIRNRKKINEIIMELALIDIRLWVEYILG